MSAQRNRAVPVIVVAGFLGAGKTTLLNHVLRTAAGRRIGVVVNDFGAVSIDALLVAGAVDGAVTLGNGCICCTVDADSLESVLAGLVAPSAGLDAVVIEASGLAEPTTLVRMVTAAAGPRITYGGLIYLVDAEHIEQTRSRHPEIDRHIAIADLVLVNKSDRVTPEVLADVTASLRDLNPTGALHVTDHSAVDTALLFDPVERAADTGPRQLELADLLDEHAGEHDGGADTPHDHHHLHDGYQSVALTVDDPLDPRRLAVFLERPPAGTYRVKGVTHFDVAGHRGAFSVHAVGGHVTVADMPADHPRSTDLIVIGSGLDAEAVHRELATLVRGDESVDRQSMLAVTRYRTQRRRAS
ncbi:CobW family GTP-binding protein [Williamsia sp. M5A3_1d]